MFFRSIVSFCGTEVFSKSIFLHDFDEISLALFLQDCDEICASFFSVCSVIRDSFVSVCLTIVEILKRAFLAAMLTPDVPFLFNRDFGVFGILDVLFAVNGVLIVFPVSKFRFAQAYHPGSCQRFGLVSRLIWAFLQLQGPIQSPCNFP